MELKPDGRKVGAEPAHATTSNEHDGGTVNPKLRRLVAWLVCGGVVAFGSGLLVVDFAITRLMWSSQGWLGDIVKAHFAAVVGLPGAALVAMAVVLFLEFNAGPIQFEAIGFKFRGASGPVVLWTFCFLAIAAAVKLVW